MTIENSIISTKLVQQVNSLSMVLLTMSDYYDLPKPVEFVVQDLNDLAESLQSSLILNEHVHLLKITC